MKILEWKRMPIGWANEEILNEMKWTLGNGSTHSSTIMVYIALCVYASAIDDPALSLLEGDASPTYNDIKGFTGLSRAMISKAIKKLVEMKRISKKNVGVKTVYSIVGVQNNVHQQRWGKIPYKFYSKKGKLRCIFCGLSVRNKSTLYALKIFLMAIKFRDNKNNYAKFSYDKIVEFAGIPKLMIKEALQVLQQNKLVIIDIIKADNNDFRQNIYRVNGVSNTLHLGTLPEGEFESLTNSSLS